jgi:hypothetical protein
MALLLGDDQKVTLSVKFETAEGNAARVDGVPAWDTSSEDLLKLTASDDGLTCVVTSVGPTGTATVHVSADADLGSGVKDIIGTMEIEVVPGEAFIAVLSAGSPEAK